MMTTSEKATQKSMTRPSLSAYTTPASCGRCSRNWFAPPPNVLLPEAEPACPSLRSWAQGHGTSVSRGCSENRSRDQGRRSSARVATRPPPGGVQGLAQQGRVVAIGRCGYYSAERDTVSVYDRGAFDALLSPIYRASCRPLATTRSLGDAAIDGYLGESSNPIIRS